MDIIRSVMDFLSLKEFPNEFRRCFVTVYVFTPKHLVLIMDLTRNPETDWDIFVEASGAFFSMNNLPVFIMPEEAIGFVQACDDLIDFYLRKLAEEGDSYSDVLLLQLGSVLGYAFLLIFQGQWFYSESQARWVIQCTSLNGDVLELNVFHKIEMRFKNGREDSILYYFEGIGRIYLEGE